MEDFSLGIREKRVGWTKKGRGNGVCRIRNDETEGKRDRDREEKKERRKKRETHKWDFFLVCNTSQKSFFCVCVFFFFV
jgi:hypothetical protein